MAESNLALFLRAGQPYSCACGTHKTPRVGSLSNKVMPNGSNGRRTQAILNSMPADEWKGNRMSASGARP